MKLNYLLIVLFVLLPLFVFSAFPLQYSLNPNITEVLSKSEEPEKGLQKTNINKKRNISILFTTTSFIGAYMIYYAITSPDLNDIGIGFLGIFIVVISILILLINFIRNLMNKRKLD